MVIYSLFTLRTEWLKCIDRSTWRTKQTSGKESMPRLVWRLPAASVGRINETREPEPITDASGHPWQEGGCSALQKQLWSDLSRVCMIERQPCTTSCTYLSRLIALFLSCFSEPPPPSPTIVNHPYLLRRHGAQLHHTTVDRALNGFGTDLEPWTEREPPRLGSGSSAAAEEFPARVLQQIISHHLRSLSKYPSTVTRTTPPSFNALPPSFHFPLLQRLEKAPQ